VPTLAAGPLVKQGLRTWTEEGYQALEAEFIVFGVPKTVVNEVVEFEGAAPEPLFLAQVMKATQKPGF